MRRLWPEEFNALLDGAEKVDLQLPKSEADGHPSDQSHRRAALKVRISQEDYERIWPLAETRYRVGGQYAGYAITLIANNPHYQAWHPADGGTVEAVSESGKTYQIPYVIVHFLLDDVRETAAA